MQHMKDQRFFAACATECSLNQHAIFIQGGNDVKSLLDCAWCQLAADNSDLSLFGARVVDVMQS